MYIRFFNFQLLPMRFHLLFLLLLSTHLGYCWGFAAHRAINKHAVFSLPSPLIAFYKKHIAFIENESVTPDKRRYSSPNEGARHYIDLDLFDSLPIMSWNHATTKYGEENLKKNGILPWHMFLLKKQLTDAFREKNAARILRLSADIGHYLADANVPLHTTSNYNGQKTNQHGIHGLWESRLPELFLPDYNLFVGKCTYIDNLPSTIWATILTSNDYTDSVLTIERSLSQLFPFVSKYSYEERGSNITRVFSYEYCQLYHQRLAGMVEKQLRNSILLTASFWYTCWVDAGTPDLSDLTYKQRKKASDTSLQNHSIDCKH